MIYNGFCNLICLICTQMHNPGSWRSSGYSRCFIARSGSSPRLPGKHQKTADPPGKETGEGKETNTDVSYSAEPIALIGEFNSFLSVAVNSPLTLHSCPYLNIQSDTRRMFTSKVWTDDSMLL